MSTGALEAAKVRRSGHVDWVEVSTKHPERSDRTTHSPDSHATWFADGHLFLAAEPRGSLSAIDVASNSIEQIYDPEVIGVDAPLRDPGAIIVHERSGDVYIAETSAAPQLTLLAAAGRRRIAAQFLELAGHGGSAVVGTAFSPDWTRLFFSSKCGLDAEGLTFEVTGPFRRLR